MYKGNDNLPAHQRVFYKSAHESHERVLLSVKSLQQAFDIPETQLTLNNRKISLCQHKKGKDNSLFKGNGNLPGQQRVFYRNVHACEGSSTTDWDGSSSPERTKLRKSDSGN